MNEYTFFLKDESIHTIQAPDKDAAFRILCEQQCKSWGWLYGEVLEVLEKEDFLLTPTT